MIKTVLFDLDGTLLPMDQVIFVKTYLGLLAKKMVSFGYDPDKLIKCIWYGTEKMVKNNGTQTNETVFWSSFADFFGDKSRDDLPIFEEFYRNEFQNVASSCGFTPEAAKTVHRMHEMGLKTVLATNPIFPALATESRLRWAGLDPKDFLLITTYENSRHSKPNPEYYRDILNTLNLIPEECLMVGNDAQEDLAAKSVGMDVFLLTDCLIDRENHDLANIPHGSFPELMDYLSQKIAA